MTHQITKGLKKNRKKYQKLNHLLVSIVGKIQNFHRTKNAGKSLNILFVPHNTKATSIACKSKYNHKRKNLVILLMITDGKKWHYLEVRSLPALLRGITSSNNGDFYCLNCFHSYRTHNKL